MSWFPALLVMTETSGELASKSVGDIIEDGIPFGNREREWYEGLF